MSAQAVRIGMISFAHMHAASYARAVQVQDRVEIAGIFDEDAARGRRQAAQFGVPHLETVEELLECRPDGVIVCSENAHHRKHVEEIAGRVEYILCEKPIASTLADARAILQTCAATGTRLQIAFPVRFSAPIQRLK